MKLRKKFKRAEFFYVVGSSVAKKTVEITEFSYTKNPSGGKILSDGDFFCDANVFNENVYPNAKAFLSLSGALDYANKLIVSSKKVVEDNASSEPLFGSKFFTEKPDPPF